MKVGVGRAVIATARSASALISTSTEVMVTLFEELPSVVCDVTSAWFVITVPAAVPALTVTTYVKAAVVVLAAIAALALQSTTPVPPTPGVAPHVHPLGGVMEAKVVLVGVC